MSAGSGQAGVRGPGAARRHALHGLGAYALACAGAGVIGAGLWRAVVKLPTYRLDASNHALIAERGLAAIFSIDAWFALVGTVAGVVLGVLAWQFFRRAGWLVVVIEVVGSLLAALVCWGVGRLLGPGRLEERLAAAQVGDLVPIDLQLHAYTTLALWPFGATLPVLILASLARGPRGSAPAGSAPASPASPAAPVGSASASASPVSPARDST